MSLSIKAHSTGIGSSIFSIHLKYCGPKCAFWECSFAMVLKEVYCLLLLINHYIKFEHHTRC